MLKCLNDWFSAIDNSRCVDVMYIDVAKAFDSVSHPKLMYKLEKYGVTGKFLNWISAFLSDRRQRVKVGEVKSEFAEVTSGVPQGSVLGPILFLIYIKDLSLVLRDCSISIFADDSKIYFKADYAECIERIQDDINRVAQWCNDWQLSVAVHKCSVLHIGRNNGNHEYSMHGNAVPSVASLTDLGITANLSFSPHISNICRSAFQRLNLIFRSFTTRDTDCLLKAYLSYVRPLLEYNTVVWSPFCTVEV